MHCPLSYCRLRSQKRATFFCSILRSSSAVLPYALFPVFGRGDRAHRGENNGAVVALRLLTGGVYLVAARGEYWESRAIRKHGRSAHYHSTDSLGIFFNDRRGRRSLDIATETRFSRATGTDTLYSMDERLRWTIRLFTGKFLRAPPSAKFVVPFHKGI